MPRPKRPRTIHSAPSVGGFTPSGNAQAGEISLSLEEYEAIRLIDFEGLDQAQASVQMGISRQTFGRVLKSARFTLSKALVKGLQLKVTGGCYQVRGYGSAHCRHGRAGRQRRNNLGENTIEELREISGGADMTGNKDVSQEQKNNNSSEKDNDSKQNQGRGQGQGQGRGVCVGGGKGSGKGRGRGQGGGKGDGSCGRS